MPKSEFIELPTGETIPILYEDRSVMAIDKPFGWMLVPMSWQNTGHTSREVHIEAPSEWFVRQYRFQPLVGSAKTLS